MWFYAKNYNLCRLDILFKRHLTNLHNKYTCLHVQKILKLNSHLTIKIHYLCQRWIDWIFITLTSCIVFALLYQNSYTWLNSSLIVSVRLSPVTKWINLHSKAHPTIIIILNQTNTTSCRLLPHASNMLNDTKPVAVSQSGCARDYQPTRNRCNWNIMQLKYQLLSDLN